MEKLRAAFQDSADKGTSHGEVNHQATQTPVHKSRIARFINKDVEDWSTTVNGAKLSAKSNWHETPEIDELPGAVVPRWVNINAYIDAGGLDHVDIHKDTVAHQQQGVRAVKRARRDEDPLSFRDYVGPPGGDASSNEKEVSASPATTRPNNSRNERKAEEAPARPHTRKSRPAFARYRARSGRKSETG